MLIFSRFQVKFEMDTIVYTNFDNDLISHWNNLYSSGANFNLSYEWCSIWNKYFGKNKSLYIITCWDNGQLMALAPFYKKRNRLFLLGTKPDLYDEFGILYQNENSLDAIFTHIRDNKLDFFFKHISSASEIGKYIIEWLGNSGIKNISEVSETKPFVNEGFSPKRKMKDDIKRCTNNAQKYNNEPLEFVSDSPKDETLIKHFISLHKKRWNGGFLVKKQNIESFITEIFMKSDAVKLSRLFFKESGKSIAYHLGYMDSNNVLWSSMPAYDTEYKKISPGKVLLFNVISEYFNNNSARFDFGRGSEPYKMWFSTDKAVLFNIYSCTNSLTVLKIRRLYDKITRKIFG